MSAETGASDRAAGGAHRDPDAAARLLMERIVHHLSELARVKPRRLVRNRADRFRSIGRFERGIVKKARDIVARLTGPR